MPRHLPLPLNPHTNYPFNLQKNLEGRQDFRWRKLPNDYHSVVLNGNLIHIRQAEDRLHYQSAPDADLSDLLRSYFRLEDDLDAIYTEITARDDHIAKLIQENTPASASCGNPTPGNASSPTSAPRERAPPRITHRVEDDCHPAGPPANPRRRDPPHLPRPRNRPHRRPRPTATNDPSASSASPTPSSRPPISSHDGSLDLHRLAQPDIPYDEAISQLTDLYCVGPKIANCIALFALNKTEAFPVDSRVRNHRQETLPVPHPLLRRPNNIVGPRPLRPTTPATPTSSSTWPKPC